MIDVNVLEINNVICIVFGIIIGYLIFTCFINKPLVKGPNSRDVIGDVFNVDGKLYTFEPMICTA